MSSEERHDRMMEISSTSSFENRDLAFRRREDKKDDDEVPCRKRKIIDESAEGDMNKEKINLKDTQGHTNEEWIAMQATRNEIAYRFKNFLGNFTDNEKKNVYRDKLQRMCEINQTSFEVDYADLELDSDLTYFLLKTPAPIFRIFDETAKEFFLDEYPSYKRIGKNIRVKISNAPLTKGVETKINLNQLVRTVGVVTATTCVLPELSYMKYDCGKCGFILGFFTQSVDTEIEPESCPKCKNLEPLVVRMKKTLYRNYQRINIQELSCHVPTRKIPKRTECILLADLRNRCEPGDEIDITGIYSCPCDDSPNTDQGFPALGTVLLANNLIVNKKKNINESLTEEDVRIIRELSQDPLIGERIVASIAPSIYDQNYVKKVLALSLFGGVTKNSDERKNRGSIHVLLCGSPQTVKSQFLKSLMKVAPRAIITTGQGNSAAGLTAYVRRDPKSSVWTLEAGAFVLADQGVCLIDEFSKMNDQDCVSIYEAMERQTISIPERDIAISLHAQCTIIAATDLIPCTDRSAGKFTSVKEIAGSVQITEQIMSGFDILCMVHNNVYKYKDIALASNEADNLIEDDLLQQDVLKKYIIYAKENIQPTLNNFDQGKINKMCSEIEQTLLGTQNFSIEIPHKYMESIIRMAEAHAKMYLRYEVNEEDIRIAITIVLNSFLDVQRIRCEPPRRMLTSQDDFAEIRYYPAYVDKSLLIEKLIRLEETTLLVAPRRFGKSTNISMLRYFFEKNNNPIITTSNRMLFKDLLIEEYESTMKQHCGRYPVIYLNFKCSQNIKTYDHAFDYVRGIVHKAYMAHKYLKQSEKILEAGDGLKKYIENWCCPVKHETYTKEEHIVAALEYLAMALYLHFDGVKVLVFIDEYDAICSEAVINVTDYIDQKTNTNVTAEVAIKNIIALCISAIGCLSKGFQFVHRVILTGVSFLLTQGLSGVNNIKECRFQENHPLREFYGLQVAEVKQLLQKFSLDSKFKEVERRYNGYRGDMYNILSVMEFLNEDGKLKDSCNYWKGSGRVVNLDKALHIPRIRSMLFHLMIDSTHDIEISYFKRLNYSDITQLKTILRKEDPEINTPDIFFYFLVEQGYFRVVELKEDAVVVRIPNLEIRLEIREKLLRFHSKHYRLDTLSVEKCASVFDEINSVDENNKKQLKEIYVLLNTIIKPVKIPAQNEATYHHIIYMILFHCNMFKSFSEVRCCDRSQRRLDIFLLCCELKIGIVIEFKFDKSADEALAQIVGKKYYEVFKREEYNPDKIDITYQLYFGINVSRNQDVTMSVLLNNLELEKKISFA